MKYSNGRPIGSEEKGKVAGTLHWKVKVEILERHPFNAEIWLVHTEADKTGDLQLRQCAVVYQRNRAKGEC